MWVRVIVATILLLLPAAALAQAEKRLALLIGNQGYTAKVGALKNPHNDVTLIETSLKQLGFKVTVLRDANYKVMDTSLKRHVTEVRRAGPNALSFFYYSGHGVANPETQINYLIPVDVVDADDDKIWFESFQQTTIIDLLSKHAPNATHYVVFDACRNELNMAQAGAKALGTEKGFVPITDTAGLLIAYATAPRKTASDLGNNGGPYAKVLAEELLKPGIEAVMMFRTVQLKVKQAIGQDPWLSFPSLPAVYFAGSKPPESIELTFWNSVKDSTIPAVLNTYLERYPNGEFASITRALIEHYERQFKAEQAAREEERKRQAEVRKAAEVKRLEEERRIREAALADERRRAEEAKNSREEKRVAERERAELVARTEELRKTLEEAQKAKEAAWAAEEQRIAAVRVAEEATKAAELAIARKRENAQISDPTKVAALPKIDKPAGNAQYDGGWYVHRLGPSCEWGQDVRFMIVIRNGVVTGLSAGQQKVEGSISPAGQLLLHHVTATRDNRPDNKTVRSDSVKASTGNFCQLLT